MMKRAAKSACAQKPKTASRSQCQERGSKWTGSTIGGQIKCIGQTSFCLRRSTFRNFAHLVLQEPAAHPADGQAIDQPAEGAIHGAVLRDSELAGAMVDRHLVHFVSLQADES